MTRARDIADTQDNLGGAVAPFVGGKNGVINGGFDIWQRGTSFTANGYSADRWYVNSGGAARTYSRQSTNDTTNLPTIQYCMRVSRNSGSSVTNNIEFVQSAETANSLQFAGKVATLSFYARKGADFSEASSQLGVYLISGTGTDQGWVSPGYTGATYPVNNQKATLTTTWQRFTFTGTMPSNSTEFSTFFYYSPTGTAGANDYYEITGVQLELGAQATPFSRAGGSIGGELALCQRYYNRITNTSGNGYLGVTGFAASTTNSQFAFQLGTQLRTGAVGSIILDYSQISLYDGTSTLTPSSITIQNATPSNCYIFATVSGATAFRPYTLISTSGAGYIGFSAEL